MADEEPEVNDDVMNGGPLGEFPEGDVPEGGEVPEDTEQPEVPEAPASPVIPDKFSGKSPEEIVAMYQALEADYGRKGELIGRYEQLIQQGVPAPVTQTASTLDPEVERILPTAKAIFADMEELELARLADLGMDTSEGLPENTSRVLQDRAWKAAREQDAKDQADSQRTKDYQAQIAPQVIGAEMKEVFTANPVQGITADEMTQMITSDPQFDMRIWNNTPADVRAGFIVEKAKSIGYDRIMSGKAAVPGAVVKAPPQVAPGSLGNGGGGRQGGSPAIEAEVSRLRAEFPMLSEADIRDTLK